MAEWIVAVAAIIGICVSVYAAISASGRKDAQHEIRLSSMENDIKALSEMATQHVRDCNRKAVSEGAGAAAVHQRITALERETDGNRNVLHWIGDCIMTIGAKMNLDLPDRPERR